MTQLATVWQIDPIYINLMQSSTDVLKMQDAMRNRKLQSVGQRQAKVTPLIEEGGAYLKSGRLLFSDLTVDPNTGSVTLRAEFSNTDRSHSDARHVRAC